MEITPKDLDIVEHNSHIKRIQPSVSAGVDNVKPKDPPRRENLLETL